MWMGKKLSIRSAVIHTQSREEKVMDIFFRLANTVAGITFILSRYYPEGSNFVWKTFLFTMKLITLHKILIGMAGIFFVFFGLRQILRDDGSPVIGALVLCLAGGIAYYFVWVIKGGYDSKKDR